MNNLTRKILNSKGQSILMTVIVGLMLFMVGMVFLNFIKPDTWVDDTPSMMSQLGCGASNSSGAGLSDGVKATCLIGEIIEPYMIIAVFSAAGGIIVSRFLL